MTQDGRISSNPDILASAKALRRAARQALELGKRTGTPVYVLRNGQIVDLVNGKPWPHPSSGTHEQAVKGKKLVLP